MQFHVWRAALVAFGVCTMAISKPNAAPVPAKEMGRCQKYFENGAGYDFTTKILEPQLRFALELHRKIPGKTPNRLTSPLSAYAALTMVAAGARGATAEELRQTLFGGVSMPAGIDGVAATMAALECMDEYRSTVFTTGNRLFLGKNVELLPEYTATLKQAFNATTGAVDFHRAAEAAATINQWVSDETRGNIPSMVEAQNITPDMRLVLVNALYILGTWAEKFDGKNTKPRPFHLENGKTVNVPVMAQRRTFPTFDYTQRAHYQMLSMGMADHAVDVLFILPNKDTTLAKVMASLDAVEFAIAEKAMERKAVDLQIPKFKIAGSASLVTALQAMGVKETFVAGKADLTGIDAGKNILYVAEVLQKTTAKVDELGFEGSAATAVMMAAGSAPPKPAEPLNFHIDRPFGFIVMHRRVGAVLFVGEVRDPR